MRLILLVEEISRQLNFHSVVWMVITTLRQIYYGKEQVGQKGMQNVKFEGKQSTRKFNVGAQSCAQGNEKFKEDLRLNGIKGGALGRYPSPTPAANPATCVRKRPKGFPPLKKHQEVKAYANVTQGGTRFHAQQKAELGSFGYLVLALFIKKGMGGKSYGVVFFH